MKVIASAVILIALAVASAPLAQSPEWPDGWIDLKADSIVYDFPHPDTIRIAVSFSVMSAMAVDSVFLTDMGVFLDGIPVYESPIEISDVRADSCNEKEEKDCYGECQMQIWPSGTKEGQCVWLHDTLLVRCVCRDKIIWPPFFGSFEGQSTISLELDMGGTVNELYEDNNSLNASIAPVAVEPSSWSRIKGKH